MQLGPHLNEIVALDPLEPLFCIDVIALGAQPYEHESGAGVDSGAQI